MKTDETTKNKKLRTSKVLQAGGERKRNKEKENEEKVEHGSRQVEIMVGGDRRRCDPRSGNPHGTSGTAPLAFLSI